MWLISRKNYQGSEDKDLLSAFRERGDRKAIGVLFERYSHLVFGVCMKYLRDEDEAKDATMTIYEKLMEDLKRFEVQKFSNWIHSVARNYCLMQLRNRKAMLHIDEESGLGWDGIVESHQLAHLNTGNDKESTLQLMEEGIRNLSEEQRICIELFYLKNHCYQDVAEISGFSAGEVKSYIQNGKRNLKIYMMKKSHEHSGR
jgi:RNA polymerase sigma factor (sigma-70 family)